MKPADSSSGARGTAPLLRLVRDPEPGSPAEVTEPATVYMTYAVPEPAAPERALPEPGAPAEHAMPEEGAPSERAVSERAAPSQEPAASEEPVTHYLPVEHLLARREAELAPRPAAGAPPTGTPPEWPEDSIELPEPWWARAWQRLRRRLRERLPQRTPSAPARSEAMGDAFDPTREAPLSTGARWLVAFAQLSTVSKLSVLLLPLVASLFLVVALSSPRSKPGTAAAPAAAASAASPARPSAAPTRPSAPAPLQYDQRLTLQRAAADALAEGRYEAAIALYRRMAELEPNHPAYGQAVRILEERLSGGHGERPAP